MALDAFFDPNRCLLRSSMSLSTFFIPISTEGWKFVILPLPNEDFGSPNQPFRMCVRITFHGREYSIWATNRWKLFRTHIRKCWFGLPKSSFGEHKVWRKFTHPKRRLWKVHHVANKKLRNFTPPKRRFWKEEQKTKCGFSTHFSGAWVLNLGHYPLKSASKIRISSFVPPSKIFVWGA